jgi:preprotein translocase subunit YajC
LEAVTETDTENLLLLLLLFLILLFFLPSRPISRRRKERDQTRQGGIELTYNDITLSRRRRHSKLCSTTPLPDYRLR